MTTNPLHSIEQIESSLWEAADQLRANSKLNRAGVVVQESMTDVSREGVVCHEP